MRITFHGAAKSVTGSRHLLEVNGRRILLDCGLFQGRRSETEERNREFPFDPAEIDAVVLSHAHIDHAGAIPSLSARGFRGPVHATLATADLASYMLRDSAFLQEKDAEFVNQREARRGVKGARREPLYTVADADRAMELFEGHGYYRAFEVGPGIRCTFYDAGHILGSAIVVLEIEENGQERSVVFSGDLGRDNLPILRNPDQVATPDVLILESTYGGREHLPIEEVGTVLTEVVNKICARRGKLIVPAFAVGRTQEIVLELAKLTRAGRIPPCPIFVDSPLATNATDVYQRHPECYDEATRALLRKEGDPFGLRLVHYTSSVEESKLLNTREGPFIVISASGMMEGGRVLHHLRNSLQDEKNAILIVGYQAQHTLGRRILRGDQVVNIFGEPHEVRAEVLVMNEFSAHADKNDLSHWVRANRGAPRTIFLVHGEEDQALALAEQLRQEGLGRPLVPELHETVPLGGADPPRRPGRTA